MTLQVEVVRADQLAMRGAIFVAERVWAAVAQRGEAHVALSGGSTPDAMIKALATLTVPWESLHIWQVDERVVPDGDPARNAGQLNPLVDAGATVHLMNVTSVHLAGAAMAYASALPRRLDVVHLGLGDDGHTASWPPGDPVVDTASPCAVVGPYNGHLRMTLTPPAINGARARCFLVSGEAKRPALLRLLTGDPDSPASQVQHESTSVLTDVDVR